MSPERAIVAPEALPAGWHLIGVKPSVVHDWFRSGHPDITESWQEVDVTLAHESGVTVELTLKAAHDPSWLSAFLVACEAMPPTMRVRDITRA